ncbi:OmpP1/FadL family transporter [Reichenbachiella sp. MSK19-1]|uniref:OmpP1/FadL family transporter n=1 Tax=Reichenbachiella sp. MSK19-1 TaxID=1897631 RepID=UPI0013148145|nr:outer membrane protein transport protein [Reichenbachiella sp. MSK19-1]
MSKVILSSVILMLCVTQIRIAQAQEGAYGYYNDALLFSRTYYGGTARMQAIGGAQVSLGGDMNAAYVNPAGLGSIRQSGITVTPSLDFNNTDAQYFGNNTHDFKANFNFANLGIAFSMPNEDENSPFKGGTFAITMTRTNNFHGQYNYDGFNTTEVGKSSIIDSYIDGAWGIQEDNLGGIEYDAYQSYLINPETLTDDATGSSFTGYYKLIGDQPRQVEKIRTTGAQYEWNFAGGANINDIFYFGGGLGITTINYFSEQTFTESEYFYDGSIDPAINSHRLINTLRIDGTGLNGTLGIIVRPIPILRVGASFKTPTIYGMYDTSSEDFLVDWNNNFVFNIDGNDMTLDDYAPEGGPYYSESKYSLSTPWKFSTGASIFLGKSGFLSADVEFTDYSSANLSSNDFSTTADNNEIQSRYQNAMNIRIGGEFRITNQFMVRAGYAHDGDPYRYSSIDNSIQRISGGLGYRTKDMFIDLSIVHTQYETLRSPYTIYSFDDLNEDISPSAHIDHKNLNASVTFGFNF